MCVCLCVTRASDETKTERSSVAGSCVYSCVIRASEQKPREAACRDRRYVTSRAACNDRQALPRRNTLEFAFPALSSSPPGQDEPTQNVFAMALSRFIVSMPDNKISPKKFRLGFHLSPSSLVPTETTKAPKRTPSRSLARSLSIAKPTDHGYAELGARLHPPCIPFPFPHAPAHAHRYRDSPNKRSRHGAKGRKKNQTVTAHANALWKSGKLPRWSSECVDMMGTLRPKTPSLVRSSSDFSRPREDARNQIKEV
jgi:hypothetical protein